MKKRILFVDDDPQLLKALKRMLWSAEARWDMVFVQTGAQAMETLDQAAFDVIVTDMRMPGIDGAQLLARVRRDFPWMMRLVLSGVSDKAMIMRSVPVAHQFLTKPVSSEQLMAVIDRGCALRDALLSEDLKRLIGQIDSLPALPAIYGRLLAELESETSTVESLAAIIAKDMALTADVLKLVNSSFFAPRVRVRTLEQAVNLLGTETIKGLVLGVKMLAAFDVRKCPELSILKLWDHSLHTARLARSIAQLENLPDETQDDCFIAGMLHDLGKFVLADKLPAHYHVALHRSRLENMTIWEAENQMLGVSHAETGAYLLGLWGLADPVLEAVAFHHAPGALGLSAMSAVTAVHAANVLEHETVVINASYAQHVMDLGHLEAVGMAHRLPVWREACAELLAQGGTAAEPGGGRG